MSIEKLPIETNTQQAEQQPDNHIHRETIPQTPPLQSQPQPAWYSAFTPWWDATRASLPTFIVTRIVFLLLTYFGVVLFTVSNYSNQALSFHTLIYGWYRWDAIRFSTIAAQGYISFDYSAFFPLYPWLIRAVSTLLHKNTFLVGMVLSNLAFLGTMIVFYRFVESEFDTDTARRATLYLAIFPTALFFFAAYNESLFIFLTLLFFYALRRRSWWLAGLFGGLATLTRSIGLFLLVIFCCEFIRQMWPSIRLTWQTKNLRHGLRILSSFCAALLIPLGMGVFAYYLNLRFHDPLAFSHAQTNWRLNLSAPWYSPLLSIQTILSHSPFTFVTTHNLIDLTMFLIFFALMILSLLGPERFSNDQWSLILFGFMAVFYSLFFPGKNAYPFLSMERFVLEVFPAFIVLARLGRRPWFHQSYLLIALPMLAFFTLQFINGHTTV